MTLESNCAGKCREKKENQEKNLIWHIKKIIENDIKTNHIFNNEVYRE